MTSFRIVTPNKNGAKYLQECLASVSGQRGNPDYEHIVVDGLSTDGSADICSNFRVKFISGTDANMYDAINRGVQQPGTYDYWSVLNSDDLLYPDTLKQVAAVFQAQPNIDIIFGDTVLGSMLSPGNPRMRCRTIPADTRLWAVFGSLPFLHPAIFLRRRVIERIGLFDITYRYSADLEYFIRAFKTCTSCHLATDLAFFRLHSEQQTRQKLLYVREENRRIAENFYRKSPSVVTQFASQIYFLGWRMHNLTDLLKIKRILLGLNG